MAFTRTVAVKTNKPIAKAKTKIGKRAGTRKQRKIDILVTTPLYLRNSNAVNRQTFANVNNSSTRHRRIFANIKRSNLVHVSCDVLHSKKNIKCGLLNVHSVNKKEHLIENLVIENDFDFFFMTETWLKPAGDEVRIQTMTPPTHNTMSLPRLTGLGGGISVTFKNIFSPYLKNDYHSKTFISFECSCSEIMIKGTKMSIFCIYRPPPSEKNKLTPSLFIKEFEDFLDSLSFFSDSHHTLLIGDFNLHYDAKDNTYVKQMLDLFEIRHFSQCATSPTHKAGHTLDWVVCKTGNLLSNLSIKDICISDHFLISFEISCFSDIEKPKRTIQSRNFRCIDNSSFCQDLRNSVNIINS